MNHFLLCKYSVFSDSVISLELFFSVLFSVKGKRGNLTERVTSVVVSLLWIVPVFFVALYFLIWQTYVLYLEVVVIAAEMAFTALELVFGIISCVTFAR